MPVLSGDRYTLDGAMIVFTDHAIERYIERIAPGRDRASALHDLHEFAKFGTVRRWPPGWTTGWPGDRWLVVGRGIAFPLRVRPGDVLVATTCKTRSGASERLAAS